MLITKLFHAEPLLTLGVKMHLRCHENARITLLADKVRYVRRAGKQIIK